MAPKEKSQLISRFTEEILTPEDLASLLSKNIPLKHYIGFEISGKIHLGTGLACMQKVKDFADAGVSVNIFLADYHTWLNDKLGGDLEAIKKTAVGYFKEGLSVAYECVGGNPKDLNFILASDFYHNNDKYWETVLEVSKHTTLSRMKRSITILGREEGGEVDFAKLIYPAMQVADIFKGGFHLPHSGIDQRKAQVIARDVARKLKISPLMADSQIIKPVAVHHHLILGLAKPPQTQINADNTQINAYKISENPHKNQRESELFESMKMSKSKPDTAVFIHDSQEEIRRKIKKAFCPEKEVVFNPIIDWAERLIFTREEKIIISRKDEYGGDLEIKSVYELKGLFKKGDIHPEDLKNFVAGYLIELLKPARERFSEGKPKEMLKELERLIEKE